MKDFTSTYTIRQILLRLLTITFIFLYPLIKSHSPSFLPHWFLYLYLFIVTCIFSYPLSPNGIPPDLKPVKFIPSGDGIPQIFPLHKFSPPIPNSQKFCETPQNKEKIERALKDAKHVQQIRNPENLITFFSPGSLDRYKMKDYKTILKNNILLKFMKIVNLKRNRMSSTLPIIQRISLSLDYDFMAWREKVFKCLNQTKSILRKKNKPKPYYSKTKNQTLFPVVSCPLVFKTYSHHMPLNNNVYFIMQKRSMMSPRVLARAIIVNVPRTNLAQYATHRVCTSEPNPIDSQAFKNNPAISRKTKTLRHPEIRRQECQDDADCKEKSCPTLCSPAKGPEKATGHLTHGTPQNPYAKTLKKLDSVDAQGNLKDQNAVFYTTPHNTGSIVKENVQATSYINQPHIIKTIKEHEDKN